MQVSAERDIAITVTMSENEAIWLQEFMKFGQAGGRHELRQEMYQKVRVALREAGVKLAPGDKLPSTESNP